MDRKVSFHVPAVSQHWKSRTADVGVRSVALKGCAIYHLGTERSKNHPKTRFNAQTRVSMSLERNNVISQNLHIL